MGQQMAISVMGTYSDGGVRSLGSGEQGTVYAVSDENILTVSVDGMVTPKAVGVGFVQVKPEASDPVIVRVEIAEPEPEIQKGDINGDGKVNLADAVLGLKILSGMAGETGTLAADVNGDNKIGMEEVLFVVKTVAGL